MAELGLVGWLLIWSTLAVLAAWLPPQRWRNALQALCGICLLASVSPLSLAWLGGGTMMSFAVTRWFSAVRGATAATITLVAASYIGWLAQAQPTGLPGSGVLLPLGMAFYTLRLIHYLAESAKGRLADHRLDELLAYQFFCAALPVGPIHRFDDFLRESRRRRWDVAQFSGGLQRVLYGLVKLIVLGHFLIEQRVAPWLAVSADQPGLEGLYASAFLLWLPLYVYFSAYSDLALGFGALMGVKLRENFNHPYLAANIADFWQRWHISLANWCRDHVYTPVLALTRSALAAVVASMLVLGVWHELSLHYVLWGLYHGLGIAAYRRFATLPRLWPDASTAVRGMTRVMGTLFTLHFVLFSFAVTGVVEHWLRQALTYLTR
ncbi:MAG: MBOAT family O-acyltransferase [Panacagrimonas sp.]